MQAAAARPAAKKNERRYDRIERRYDRIERRYSSPRPLKELVRDLLRAHSGE